MLIRQCTVRRVFECSAIETIYIPLALENSNTFELVILTKNQIHIFSTLALYEETSKWIFRQYQKDCVWFSQIQPSLNCVLSLIFFLSSNYKTFNYYENWEYDFQVAIKEAKGSIVSK